MSAFVSLTDLLSNCVDKKQYNTKILEKCNKRLENWDRKKVRAFIKRYACNKRRHIYTRIDDAYMTTMELLQQRPESVSH